MNQTANGGVIKLDAAACERARLARDARFDGRFFTAVVSTGIYCRPVCPAPSPKSANVRYYPSAAAAAEAGFRPCLRCRPEASPGTPGWTGAPSSVSRGLRLIAESALDEGSVEDLAGKLGMGSRHLRRLFLEHLGATPVAIAQTRRVHFAKRLIDETDLPMTEVAMASGFGSIRRFNATFRGLYGRSPSELRRHEGARTPGQYEFRLEYRPPYDWDALIAFLAARATPGVESVTPEEYRRTITLDGEAGAITVGPARGNALFNSAQDAPGARRLDGLVSAGPRAGRFALLAHIRFPRAAALFRIVERIRRIFDLGADPAAISAALKKDPQLRPMIAGHPGLRVPGCWDGFELAVRAVLGQQVSVKAATTLAGRLASAFGAETQEGILFPTAESLAEADLSRIGLTSARVRTIHALAQAVTKGLAIEDTAGLTSIPGIGEWTAQYIAMRLGEPDAFPGTDLYLRAHASRSESWRPWRAYAALHIWTSNKQVTK